MQYKLSIHIVDVTTFKFKFDYPRKTMADLTEISQLATSILARFEELSVGGAFGEDLQYAQEARNIVAAISLVDWDGFGNLEEIVREIRGIIASASVKMQKAGGRGQNEQIDKVLGHQSSLRAEEELQNGEQRMEELSDCCWIFIQKMDSLFKQQIRWSVRQTDKQNRKQKETSYEQTCLIFIKMLKDIKRHMEHIKTSERKEGKEKSQTSKLHCESEGGKKNVTSQSNSSCRSLLTEKLKNITTVDNDEENGLFCVEDKVVIKGNWVLREMKGHQNQKGSQPRYIRSFDQESYEANVRSMGMPLVHRKTQRTELPSRKGILEQIQPFAESKKEKKPQKTESGCARCEIY